jgi:hypothetical protein
MKELDFDELDRAVNSLMGGVATSAPVKQDDVKTLTIESTLTDATPPVFPVGTVDAPAEVAPAPAPREAAVSVRTEERVTPLANRRSGRFMDVVHPSSDMKKVAPSQSASRQGVTLEPLTQPGDFAGAPVEEFVPETTESLAFEEPTVATFEEATTTSDWPDPIDASSEPTELPTPDEQPEPLSSPFLPDAKVEKRPLGGATAPELMVADEAMPSLEDEFASPEVVEASQSPAPIDLPEELQGDLVAIEAGDSSVTPEVPPVLPTETPTEASEPEKKPVTSEQPMVVPAAATSAPAVMSTGPVSIPQQYREEPSTGDQTSGSIYDTASYHQPLEHPAQKKSGWLWVIWVLILLILGAGGGALAYFYLLQ